MGHTYHQNGGHVIFHVASVPMREADVERIMAYIAGIANWLNTSARNKNITKR